MKPPDNDADISKGNFEQSNPARKYVPGINLRVKEIISHRIYCQYFPENGLIDKQKSFVGESK